MTLAQFKLVFIPLAVALLTQTVKFAIRWSQTKRFDWSVFNQYGGMPSGHTAFVVSLCTVIGLSQGLTSAVFAVSVVVALLAIRDSVSFRQYLSHYGRTINRLVDQHPLKETASQRIEERLGHTPLQAVVGGLLGLFLSTLFYLWIP